MKRRSTTGSIVGFGGDCGDGSTMSSQIVTLLNARSWPPEKLSVIHNLPPRRPARRALPARDDGAFVISYVGQLAVKKGVGLLLEAFLDNAARWPKARLWIIGANASRRDPPEIAQLAERAKAMPDRVVFYGFRDDVDALLAQSHVHVAPSLHDDPSPNVVLEAKRACAPSIVFAKGGLPELVVDGVEGQVCRDATAEDLAAAIDKYYTDRACRDKHGAAAQASLETRFGQRRFDAGWAEALRRAGGGS